MSRIIKIKQIDIMPAISAVLKYQGVPEEMTPDLRTAALAEESISVLGRLARPIGILMDISREDFANVYDGEGKNEPDAPLGPILMGADKLALFAVTLGEEVCDEITRLFGTNEFALGSMLDSAASEATEMAAQAVEDDFLKTLVQNTPLESSKGILRFSPGYCGWHITAQRKLFGFLQPEMIGIRLRESFLMEPLKSISGVIVTGPKEIFYFDDDFSFCAECETHSCRDRIMAMIERGIG